MNKVLIIQEIIPHYRIPLFNAIGKSADIDLTIAHDGTSILLPSEITDFKVATYQKRVIKSIVKIKDLLALTKGYDTIIILADLHWIPNFILLLLLRKKSRLFFWGIGISSQEGLKKKTFVDKLRFLFSDISSGTILYSPKIAEYYVENVNKKNQVYVAKNTVFVEKLPFSDQQKTRILSIGSFKKYKNLSNLIIAFNDIINQIPANITLDFIGDGDEEDILVKLVNDLNLNDRVIFWGRKESDLDIYPIISQSMVCVSPTQAGLAVLHAMAFGCPFLTSEDAVTGGERFYIEDNVNGYFYDGSIDQLAKKLLWIINNPTANDKVAHNAYHFYHNKCSIQNYADSFIEIITN